MLLLNLSLTPTEPFLFFSFFLGSSKKDVTALILCSLNCIEGTKSLSFPLSHSREPGEQSGFLKLNDVSDYVSKFISKSKCLLSMPSSLVLDLSFPCNFINFIHFPVLAPLPTVILINALGVKVLWLYKYLY